MEQGVERMAHGEGRRARGAEEFGFWIADFGLKTSLSLFFTLEK